MNNYNIGAGSFRHRDWINVDHYSDWYNNVQDKFIEWDLLTLTPINVKSNTADLIYSSHCIEHVTDDAVINMLNESYRILKPGGIIRIQAPNIDIFYSFFKNGKRIEWVDKKVPKLSKIPFKKASIPQTFLWTFAANATEIHVDGAEIRLSDDEIVKAFETKFYQDALDYCKSFVSMDKQRLYPGNHINWWNPNKLIDMFKQVGFRDVYESKFGQSVSKEMRNTKKFDYGHKGISMYIESIK